MAQTIEARYAGHQQRLARSSQAQVLRFWDQLDAAQRTALLDDLDAVDLDLVDGLIDSHVRGDAPHTVPDALEPPDTFPFEPDIDRVGRYADALKRGVSFIRQNKVAVLTLPADPEPIPGRDGLVATLPVSPVRKKSSFQLFAEYIQGINRRYGADLTWYVMRPRQATRSARSE